MSCEQGPFFILEVNTAQKMKFSIKDFFSKCETADLVKFFEEILNGKLHFLCSVRFIHFAPLPLKVV